MAASTLLRVGHRAERCTVLGPGARAVIWLQGCGRRCPGCLAPELWPAEGGLETTAEALADWVLEAPDIGGLTISGGEPMDQAEGLLALLTRLRAARPEISLLCYTGYTLQELRASGGSRCAVLGLLDVLVDGPYVEALDDGGALRGSSNQRVWLLSDRHTAEALGRGGGRAVEVVVEWDGFYLMGIPPRGFRARLEATLESQGVRLGQHGERDDP